MMAKMIEIRPGLKVPQQLVKLMPAEYFDLLDRYMTGGLNDSEYAQFKSMELSANGTT